MIPGIDPTVDYAFKKLFGSEVNTPVLMSLLDAVLNPPPDRRIVALEILNRELGLERLILDLATEPKPNPYAPNHQFAMEL